MKKLRFDLSENDQEPRFTGSSCIVEPHDSPLRLEDGEDLNTGRGKEKFVGGVGGSVDAGGQGKLGDHGDENGVGQEEVDLQVVDKGGGNEADEPSEIVAQDGDSSE